MFTEEKYKFAEPEEQPDGSIISMEFELTYSQILDQYFEYWDKQIAESTNSRAAAIRKLKNTRPADYMRACVDDFVTIHWGVRLYD